MYLAVHIRLLLHSRVCWHLRVGTRGSWHFTKDIATPNEMPASISVMPTMPERAASQVSPRGSEYNDPKPIWRNSQQSTAPVRQTAPPSIIERPSEAVSLNPFPSHQQLHMWQPARQHSPNPHPIQETRHGRPGNYARSTSSDYTLFNGIDTPGMHPFFTRDRC